MKKHRPSLARMVLLAILASGAMVLSYLEMLLPPLVAGVPGIKMGLANLIVVFVLYRMGGGDAVAVSLLRLCGVALLFGTPVTFLYSLAGALLSLTGMLLLRRMRIFSPLGVSIAGGVLHNAGQVLLAAVLLRTPQLGYYMVLLSVSGTLAGALIGLAAGLLLRATERILPASVCNRSNGEHRTE